MCIRDRDWAGDIPAAITKCNQAIFDLGGEDENNAEQEALIAPAPVSYTHLKALSTNGTDLTGRESYCPTIPSLPRLPAFFTKKPKSCMEQMCIRDRINL